MSKRDHETKTAVPADGEPRLAGAERVKWIACHDTIVCFGAKEIQKWCVRERDKKGPLVAVMLTKEVAHLLAAAPDMFSALPDCLTLIDDMSRFIGTMSLKDYQLFNEAPINARAAIRKAKGRTP